MGQRLWLSPWMQGAAVGVMLASCMSTPSGTPQLPQDPNIAAPITATAPTAATAQVTAVAVTGEPGAYTFAVTVQSDDIGCEQYADWWEVVTANGELVYRRILAHSHVEEQPFQRRGGPVAIQSDDWVIVRAHLHPTGYGTQVM